MSAPHVIPSPSEKKVIPAWQIIAALVILTAAPLWQLHTISKNIPSSKADMVAVWKAAQAAFHGQNPYLNATTLDIQRFYYGHALTAAEPYNPMAYAYPMHTVLLFAPIAPLPWSIVRPLFLVLLPVLTALSVPLWIKVAGLRFTRNQTLVATALCLCSWPAMWAVHQIQPTLIVAFLAAAGCRLLQRGNAAAAGVLFALATIKPQLVGILLLWIFLWAALRRLWSFFLSFGATLAVLLAASFKMLPGWVASWRHASAEHAIYRHLQLDLQAVFGHLIGLFIAIALIAIALPLLWKGRRCAPDSPAFGAMCALTLSLTLCILPSDSAMTYNYVLVFPACLIIVASAPFQRSYSALARSVALGLIGWSYFTVLIAALALALGGLPGIWELLPFETMLLPATVLLGLIVPLLESNFSRRSVVTLAEQLASQPF
ncbi:MAG TPA: glycosyltransferase family 87 protein [Acidobacteriaceae bacterium]|nr:glycosyltransferase family 87 protein [Acidobacteriaceae bacterium]